MTIGAVVQVARHPRSFVRRPLDGGSPVRPLRGTAVVLAIVAVSLVAGVVSAQVDSVLLPASILLFGTLALAVRAPRTVVLATLVALPFVGLVRRISGSYTFQVDPLALAAPALAVICVLVLSFDRDAVPRSPLTNAVTALVGVGVIQILNPAQGGLTAGVLGAGLFVGPLVWFYVGHRIGDQATLDTVIRAMKIVVVVTAVYGIKQLLFGFAGFELSWIDARRSSYAALDISGRIRPFSTFSSGAEYAYFLALGAVLFSVRSGPIRRVLRAGVVLVLLVACFYAGSRTVFVTAVVSVLVVVLVQRVRSLGRALILCIAIGAIGLLLLRLVPLSSDDTTVGAIRNRTLTGLVRPFDRDSSTLGIHLDAFARGIGDGVRTPLGRGAAAVNLAGVKLGGQTVAAEHDFPNMLLAYGWAGLLILIVLMVRVYRMLKGCVRNQRRKLLGPGVFVLGTFGVWFAGELYAATALVWFFLGALDRLNGEAEGAERATAAATYSP